MCLLSILSATTWQQHLALWSPLFEMAGTTKSSALGAAGWSLAAASGGHSSHCVVSKRPKGSSVWVLFLPGWMTTLIVGWSCLLIRLHWFRALCYSFPLHEWMMEAMHCRMSVCVFLWVECTLYQILTMLLGALGHTRGFVWPIHSIELNEWVSEWIERRDGAENS